MTRPQPPLSIKPYLFLKAESEALSRITARYAQLVDDPEADMDVANFMRDMDAIYADLGVAEDVIERLVPNE